MQLVTPDRVLIAQQLLLQPIEPSHAPLLFSALQAPELYQFIPHNPPTSLAVLVDRYTRWAKRQSADGSEIWLNYAIYHTSRSIYVGTLQATLYESGTTYIAYEVFPPYWRQGLARVTCTAMIDHLFTDYQVATISALIDTRNEASWQLLESIGFQRIKTIKNADEFKGFTSDEYLYELSP